MALSASKTGFGGAANDRSHPLAVVKAALLTGDSGARAKKRKEKGVAQNSEKTAGTAPIPDGVERDSPLLFRRHGRPLRGPTDTTGGYFVRSPVRSPIRAVEVAPVLPVFPRV